MALSTVRASIASLVGGGVFLVNGIAHTVLGVGSRLASDFLAETYRYQTAVLLGSGPILAVTGLILAACGIWLLRGSELSCRVTRWVALGSYFLIGLAVLRIARALSTEGFLPPHVSEAGVAAITLGNGLLLASFPSLVLYFLRGLPPRGRRPVSTNPFGEEP